MAKKNNVPTCLGHYDRGDTVCDGDPESSVEDDRKVCFWRDRCGGFKAHLESSGESIDKFLTFPDDDHATVPDRETFAAFCQDKAEAFKVVDGLPTDADDEEDEDEEDFSDLEDEGEDDDGEDEDEDEGEGDEEDADEEDADEEDEDEDEDASTDHDGDNDNDNDGEEAEDAEDPDAENDDDLDHGDGDNGEEDGVEDDLDVDGDNGEDNDGEDNDAGEASTDDAAPSRPARKASVKKTKAKKKAKKRKSTAKKKPKGERETNSKWAAQQRRESLALYRHFEEALSEGLNGYAFTEPKQAPLPGQLYVADRRELSGYVSVYCKTGGGRDIPVVSIKLRPRLTEIDVDLPVTVKMLRARLSKAKLSKLTLKQLKGGVFRARIVGLDKEKAAIVAEVVHELVKTKAINLPSPLWA